MSNAVGKPIQGQRLVGSRRHSARISRGIDRNATCGEGGILVLEAQPQRRIAGRAGLAPGLITIEPGGDLLAPGRRIFKRRLVAFTGHRGFGRGEWGRSIRARSFRLCMRRGSKQACVVVGLPTRRRGGVRVGRAAADVTTKRTRHESQSYQNAGTQSRPDNHVRITMNTAPESKIADGFASRGAAVLSSPRLRMIWFRQSFSDDSSQQIPYHGGGALSPSSRPAVSYQPVAACKG